MIQSPSIMVALISELKVIGEDAGLEGCGRGSDLPSDREDRQDSRKKHSKKVSFQVVEESVRLRGFFRIW
jgi:hypothetical protein